MLKELKINGSKIPSLTLAKGGIINTLWLNPLTTLTVKELKKLNEEGFKYDEEIFNTLTQICIQDSSVFNEFGYALAMHDHITHYCFNNIEWQVPTNDITILDDDISIQVLDKLLNEKGYVEVSNRALALTGKLILNLENNLSENSIDEYKLYAKYKKLYPNLNIEFSGNIGAVKRAPIIKFYNDYNEETGEYGDKIYEVKTNGTIKLGILTSDTSPSGLPAIGTPTKESDQMYDYYWTGEWKDNNGKVYTD
jgi:hypothetical protein